MIPRLIIFDDGCGQFGPITDLRACFEVRTGMLTTGARIAACWPNQLAGYWTPTGLRAVVAERVPQPVNSALSTDALLCVNGRWLLPDASHMPRPGTARIEEATGDVIAAMLVRADAERFLTSGELPPSIGRETVTATLARHPWDILKALPTTLATDLAVTRMTDAVLPGQRCLIAGHHPVSIHATAQLFPGVILDATHGSIMIHERAVIRPGAVLCGPCAVGPDSTIIDRALIKANTVIGPSCKVAGEVGGTIFQGFSNKAHDGHLGDSWVGKWVNFGAGTTNSNLLNTYGEVTMRLEPDGPRLRTGTTFLGAIIGDHAKFAIGTRIMTGTSVGTGAMLAATAPPPTTVRRFAWITDEGERTYRLDKFLDVMTTVMARRKETPGSAYLDAVKALHARYAA
jgi:UDP-N-acetylglucosamine diphosphorylase / glucose-1-phosphate thymidylyltransferase / UDP-N-acetylgalactosamine diphosphorylase / glucosamine-1-phosphate N-acetyltransferase / galactosamine-1-phosphate N-acetyltransferase